MRCLLQFSLIIIGIGLLTFIIPYFTIVWPMDRVAKRLVPSTCTLLDKNIDITPTRNVVFEKYTFEYNGQHIEAPLETTFDNAAAASQYYEYRTLSEETPCFVDPKYLDHIKFERSSEDERHKRWSVMFLTLFFGAMCWITGLCTLYIVCYDEYQDRKWRCRTPKPIVRRPRNRQPSPETMPPPYNETQSHEMCTKI